MRGGACGPRFDAPMLLAVLFAAALRAGTYLRAAKPVPARVQRVRACSACARAAKRRPWLCAE